MKPTLPATLLLSAAAAALVALAGCTTNSEGPPPPPPGPVAIPNPPPGPAGPPLSGRADPYLPPQINLSDAQLHDVTAFGAPRLTRDAAGLLHVDVPVRNTTPDQFPVDYRITYYDQNGIPLGPPANWAPVTLAPNVFQDIQANCWTPRGYDFKMDLRYAR